MGKDMYPSLADHYYYHYFIIIIRSLYCCRYLFWGDRSQSNFWGLHGNLMDQQAMSKVAVGFLMFLLIYWGKTSDEKASAFA